MYLCINISLNKTNKQTNKQKQKNMQHNYVKMRFIRVNIIKWTNSITMSTSEVTMLTFDSKMLYVDVHDYLMLTNKWYLINLAKTL